MIDKPIYYELPVCWKNKQSEELEKLGIDSSKLEDDIDVLTIDIMEIAGFNPCDDGKHTMVRTYFGVHFIVNIPYEAFKKFFMDRTNIAIHVYEQ